MESEFGRGFVAGVLTVLIVLLAVGSEAGWFG